MASMLGILHRWLLRPLAVRVLGPASRPTRRLDREEGVRAEVLQGVVSAVHESRRCSQRLSFSTAARQARQTAEQRAASAGEPQEKATASQSMSMGALTWGGAGALKMAAVCPCNAYI